VRNPQPGLSKVEGSAIRNPKSVVTGAVISVGNALMTDDGIGEAVVDGLAQAGVPDNVRLVHAGADPLRVVQEVEALDFALVVDAAGMNLKPGEVRCFPAEDVGERVRMNGPSVHGINLNAVVLLAKRLGIAGRLRFAGVQPGSLEPGHGLSPELRQCLPDVIARVRQDLENMVEYYGPKGRCDARDPTEE